MSDTTPDGIDPRFAAAHYLDGRDLIEPGAADQEAFCDSHCCWSGHHPDCFRADGVLASDEALRAVGAAGPLGDPDVLASGVLAYVTYAHKEAPNAERFRQLASDPLPPWAVDVRPDGVLAEGARE